MRQIKIGLEFCLELFSSWTLAYLLCLGARTPAWTVVIPFVLFLLPMLYASGRHWRGKGDEDLKASIVWLLLLISAILGVFTVVVRRPDVDDLGFFHRALVQFSDLNKPFLLNEGLFDTPGISALTILHHMTSYEMLVTMSARLFRVDPLWAYYNAFPFVAAVIVPFVYYWLYREFGAGAKIAVGATALAMLFLLIDGNVHRSFGNFAFVRLFQGKCVAITLALPATILLARAFLQRPGPFGLFRLAMVGICGVGLSNVGIYMVPLLVLAMSVSFVVVERFSAAGLKTALLASASMFVPVLMGLALVAGLLPGTHVTYEYPWGYPLEWYKNLQVVIDSAPTLIRDLLLLLIVPLVGLTDRTRYFVIVAELALCLFFANPITGKIWIHLIYPASYWRLAYLLPLPFLFGLLAPAFKANGAPRRERLARATLAMMVLAWTAAAFKASTVYGIAHKPDLHIVRMVDFKSPFEYNLPLPELAFARSITDALNGRDLLGPDDFNAVIGLVNPSVRFEVPRSDYTAYAYSRPGMAAEGITRLQAQQLVDVCDQSPENLKALAWSVSNGVNAIVTRDCPGDSGSAVAKILAAGPGAWTEAGRGYGYILFIRTQ